ncbi:hypothetical protein WA158_002340 [Blastocystis sp. Blastoise]
MPAVKRNTEDHKLVDKVESDGQQNQQEMENNKKLKVEKEDEFVFTPKLSEDKQDDNQEWDVDNMTDDELRAKVNPAKWHRPVRLYADGIFDLFHYGHARALEQAKKMFPNVYLLVGCCNDEITHKLKGMTVMTDKERYESLRHCKWVDEIIEDAPWYPDVAFLNKHNIDFICHDALPYAGDGVDDVYKSIKEAGRFLATQRTEGVSTTELINRIVSNYETYIRRNLKRGVSAKELNIPYVKEKSIQLEEFANKWMDKITKIQPGFLQWFDKGHVMDTVKDKITGYAREALM